MIETKYEIGQKIWYLEQDSYGDESAVLKCPICDGKGVVDIKEPLYVKNKPFIVTKIICPACNNKDFKTYSDNEICRAVPLYYWHVKSGVILRINGELDEAGNKIIAYTTDDSSFDCNIYEEDAFIDEKDCKNEAERRNECILTMAREHIYGG